jgi:hypothetical protein
MYRHVDCLCLFLRTNSSSADSEGDCCHWSYCNRVLLACDRKGLSRDPDLNESLSDFQFSAHSVGGKLHDAGIDFQVIYASSFGIKCGGKTKTFHPQKTEVGYYFVEPGKSPHVEYGVMTDADISLMAKKYFRPAPKS